jgi:acetyl esterase/lipase
MKKSRILVFTALLIASFELLAQTTGYRAEMEIPYCTVDGVTLKLNAFLPENMDKPVAAVVDIHGGWWTGGGKSGGVPQEFSALKVAFFSIDYRLGDQGGFPQNIRDCRNAIRFIRKNAQRFNIDPTRMDVTGGSAGGHLSLMVAMVPAAFDDGGPTDGLAGVDAHVSGSFSYIPPTDFVRFWNEGTNDVITNADGSTKLRGVDPKIPNDSRPHFRQLFHGVGCDSDVHRDLYLKMSPISYIRKDVPPLLICDGERDPIVPGLEGRELFEKLQSIGADATYWMTTNGPHGYPNGTGFTKVRDDFFRRTLKLESP